MGRLKIRRLLPLALLCTALLTGVGCDAQKLQDDFAEAANRAPSGYTSTDRTGAVQNEDADDWRTAPLYAGKVRVSPAYPNPTAGETVVVAVSILEFGGLPGGLTLQAYGAGGRLVVLDVLRDTQPGTYLLSFSPAAIGRADLVRVFLLDGSREFVSYGDVLLS